MKMNGYDLGVFGIVGADQLAAGKVALANEGAFADTFLSNPLTDYVAGATEQVKDLESLLAFIAPKVRTSRRFEYKTLNAEDELQLMSDNGDVRALYGEFAMVKSNGDIVQAKTVSKGLSTVIERDTELEGDREAKALWLKRLLIRTEIYRAYNLLAATAGSATAKTWGTSATPDADLLAAINDVGDATGVNANRVLFGSTAWQKRIGAVLGHASGARVPLDLGGVANILGIEEARVSYERYTTGSTKTKIATAADVVAFVGQKFASVEDASTLKQFWSPVKGASEFAVYVDEKSNPALTKITVCHNTQIAVTCAGAAKRLTIS